MNILFHTAVSPYGNLPVGGAETSMRLLAEKLAEHGHTVYFISKGNRRSFQAVTSKVIEGVRVISFYKFPNPLRIYRLDALAGKQKQKFLEKLLITKKIDIVYTYYNLSICRRYLNFKSQEGFHFKLVVRIAGMRWMEQVQKNQSLKKKYSNLFEQADSLNFISKGLFILFQNGLSEFKMNVDIKQYFIKDIGVNLDAAKYKYKPSAISGTFNCIMVSRFSNYQKRQDILVKAVQLIPSNIPFHLTLIGDGPKRNEIEEKVKKLGLSERISFMSFMPQADLWQEISKQHLLCHACEYEGLSKIIIESMSIGLPVLASDVLPLNAYIEHNHTGFLVSNEPKAWAEKLVEIYQHRDQLSEISHEGMSFIKEHYNASQNVIEYERQFNNLIEPKEATK